MNKANSTKILVKLGRILYYINEKINEKNYEDKIKTEMMVVLICIFNESKQRIEEFIKLVKNVTESKKNVILYETLKKLIKSTHIIIEKYSEKDKNFTKLISSFEDMFVIDEKEI